MRHAPSDQKDEAHAPHWHTHTTAGPKQHDTHLRGPHHRRECGQCALSREVNLLTRLLAARSLCAHLTLKTLRVHL